MTDTSPQLPGKPVDGWTLGLRALTQTGALGLAFVIIWRLFDFIEATCKGSLP